MKMFAQTKRIKLASALICLAALQGCGTISNKTGVDRVTAESLADASKGTVVLSTGAPTHCMSTSTFLSLSDATTRKVVWDLPSIGMDSVYHKSDFQGHHGTVNAVQLPPGKYALTPVVMNPYVSTVTAPTFEFTVAAGELTYAGELFMTASCALRTSFQIRDQYERDTTIARSKSPALTNATFVKRLLTPGPTFDPKAQPGPKSDSVQPSK